MLLPVITDEGSAFYLDMKLVFSVTLNGDRIVYNTIDNKKYFQPVAIEQVALFLKEDEENNFHAADRKNLVNLTNVNCLNSDTQQLQYSENIRVDVSRINLKNIKTIKKIEDVAERKEHGNIVEYAPMTRRKSLFNFGR